MIELTKRIKIEVLVDAPLAPKVAALAEKAGITGHTLMRTMSGRGRNGEWSDDLVTGATAKYIFLTICNAQRSNQFVALLTPLLDSHNLVVLQSEVSVVRPERF